MTILEMSEIETFQSHFSTSMDKADADLVDISHELRTPLTVIQGTLNLLEGGFLGNLSEDGQRMIAIASNNVDRLMRLTCAIEADPDASMNLLSAEAMARFRLEADLRAAIPRQEFRLFYQPIISLTTGRLVGFEALIRWMHPAKGLIAPDRFIPLAEATELIIPMGNWVLQEACQQLRSWQQQFPTQSQSLTVSVNLSSQHIPSPQLVPTIEQVLDETGLNPHSLKLEVTESVIVENAAIACQVLGRLKDLGIQIYVDDFGTGYSSLSRLHELPIDVLKIDRTFVDELASERGGHLVQAIVGLAKNLGMQVIAEGIETLEQKLHLQALGCERGQGYFFAKPLPAELATSLIANRQAIPTS